MCILPTAAQAIKTIVAAMEKKKGKGKGMFARPREGNNMLFPATPDSAGRGMGPLDRFGTPSDRDGPHLEQNPNFAKSLQKLSRLQSV